MCTCILTLISCTLGFYVKPAVSYNSDQMACFIYRITDNVECYSVLAILVHSFYSVLGLLVHSCYSVLGLLVHSCYSVLGILVHS